MNTFLKELLGIGAWAAFTASTYGATLALDGVDNYMSVPSITSLAPGNTPHSIEAWVKPQALPPVRAGLMVLGNYSLGAHHWLLSTNGAVQMGVWGDTHQLNPVIPLGVWTHLAAVSDGTRYSVFTNGILFGITTNVAGLFNLQGIPLTLGNAISASENYFTGVIDEVRIWSTARSAAEIQQNMKLRLSGTEAGLLAYYPMEDPAGTVVADGSGHGNYATLNGGAVLNLAADALGPVVLMEPATSVATNRALLNAQVSSSGPVTNYFQWGPGSTALRFSGDNDEVIVPHDVAFNSYPLTLTAWVRVKPGANGGIMNKYAASANGWRMYVNAGRVRAVYFRDTNNHLAGNTPGSSEVVTGPIDDGQWHHVAFTVDASGGKVYIDGRLGGTAPWLGTPGPATITAPVEIGQAAGVFLNGQLDDAAIWNVALSSNAIANLIAAGQTTGHAQYANVVAHWDMNAGTGIVAADVSGHLHDGAFAGQPIWRSGARPVLTNQTAPLAVSGTNQVLDLNGANHYVDVPDGVWFNGGPFTIEGWVFPRNYASWSRLIDFGNGPGVENVMLAISEGTSGRPVLHVYKGGVPQTLSTPTPLPLNQWTHLSVTHDGVGTARIYFNGVLVAQGPVQTPGNVIRTNNYIGRSNWAADAYANALFDDLRLWNVARTADQIRQGINLPPAPSDPALRLNYRFDENVGTTVVDSRTTSPQNGTLMNGAGRLPLQQVTVPLLGLTPGTRYHFRSVVQSTNGISRGGINSLVTLTPGPGTALDFDGFSGHAIAAGIGDAMAGETTVEFWMKANELKEQAVFNLLEIPPGSISVSQFRARLPRADGSVSWDWGVTPSRTLTYTPPVPLIGAWHHFALVSSASGNYRAIFQDGILKVQVSGADAVTLSGRPLVIGRYVDGLTNSFNGELDEFRVWNMARSQTQIQQSLNVRLNGDEPGLVACLRLDEGAGPVLLDAGVNARHGLLVNAPDRIASTAPVGVPVATTLAATSVGFGNATLNGSVSGDGTLPSRFWFEYGPQNNLSPTPTQSLSAAASVQTVTITVSNLGISSLHQFRLVAANDNGTNYGATLQFLMPVPGARTAFEFDGINDYVSLGSDNALKITGSNATWEAWIRPDTYKNMIILNKEGEYEIGLLPNGQLWWALANTTPGWTVVQTGIVPPLQQWMHVAFVYSGTNMVLYTNGVAAATNVASGAIGDAFSAYNEFRVGGRQDTVAAGSGYWLGGIDEVRVWNIARSAADIAASFNRSLITPAAGLLVYLRFDEGSGNTTANLGSTGIDGIVNGPLAVPSAAQIIDPVVTTLAASPVLATSATLRGSVNPSGESTTTFFEYGTTTAYGSPTTRQNYPASLTTLFLSAPLSGLEPGTPYHYRMVAYDTVRTNYGVDQTFTTLVLGSGWPVSTKLTGGEASSPLHVLDGVGNTYVAGVFSGSATFRSSLSPAGGATANAFVGKMSRSADWLWAVNIPSSSNGFTLIKAIALDADRSVYVAGQFSGTNTFGSTQLVSTNDTNLFVAKIDSNGSNWLWAKATGGVGPDSANAIAVVGTNVFVAGSFSGTASFTSNLVSVGGSDVFVASLDSTDGDWLWANRSGGISNDFANALATDASTNIYVAGQYAGTNIFGTTVPTVLTNAGGIDLFVAKLTPAGAWLLARRGGGVNNDAATALVRDAGNQIYLLGQFGGAANYGGTVDNLNVGNNTNLFVLKLNTEASYLDYSQAGIQGGSASARAMGVDSLGRVYVSGQFNFSISFGTNALNSSGNSDVFIAQLVDGDWTWAQQIGAAGTETAGSISADSDNSVVISGTYQGRIQIGYVALSSPNNQDIFVARLDANRVYEHNNYVVGQPIPVPVDAQDAAYGDGAIGQPSITILEKDQPDSDALNSFAWSISEHKMFPVRQVTAIFKWPLTTNPTNITSVVTAVGRTRFPTNPQIHVASAPVELEPNVAGFSLKFLNLSFTTVPGANVDAGTKQFQAAQPGWSVIQFLDSGGALPDPTQQPSVFEVVRTIPWNDPDHLQNNQPAVIGTALTYPAHNDPTGKNGYVFFERAFYDGAGDERAYDRPSRTGPILPVNKDTVATNDDLVVVWYSTSPVTGIGWPDKPVRYSAAWPTDAEELVLASGAGSGVLSPVDFPSPRVYNQPDPTLPGYNPNEEHAALYGSTLYALRNDLNTGIGASEPFVLLKYQDPGSGQWAMKVFKVVTTNATFNFAYSAEAGQELLLPPPLSLLTLCGSSNQIVSGPGFKDYQGRLYARAAGSNSSGAIIVARYSYPLQPQFFYDLDRNGQPDAPVGTCVPWLDRRSGGTPGQSIDITYNIRWPANAPVLQIGETLLGAKFGLPDVRNFANAQIIFDQANPNDTNALNSLVRLFDPLSERTLKLPDDFVLPPDINTAMQGGRKVFTGLPYAIRSRLLYDELNKQISFRGLLDEDARYGGPDNPLLLINVLSPRERDKISQLSSEPNFVKAINDLYDLTRNPNRLDINPKDGTPDKSLLIGLQYEVRPDGTTNVNSVVHEKLGDSLKALTAGPGTGSGFVTIAENNDPALGGLPVQLHVIRVDSGPFRGDLKVILSDNVFDEKLTIRHSADFGGEPQRFEFEWYYQPDSAGFSPTNLPTVLADGQLDDLNGWILYAAVPSGINGFNDITFGDAGESGLLVLGDNWVICRYRGYVINGQTNWSDWVGAIGGGKAQLAEGWVKRVRDRLGPFEARTTNFHASETVTFASMLQQAGTRYEGDIAFNPDADNINNVGLIEAYQTVLQRAKRLSIEGAPPVNFQPANDALLLAAGFIADLYLLLGNEAYADAADPTIGFRTSSAGYGTLAPSIFTFQNQVDSLLEEELALLRGRDDRSATVRAAPVYNRLFWNFTHDEGEVAYAQAYNITDQNNDGLIDANDARIMYPQGHGDAWGHYLTATKTYYSLLQNPQFDWKPRSEFILLAGVPVEVDYQDERKFARAAAAKAKAGAEIVDLSYRLGYVDDPAGQFQGYKDTDPNRAWGLSEWGHRAGSAALFDWVLANAILPATDPDTNHVGIEKIDRTTVSELDEIIAGYEAVQNQVNKADAGLNPLGLAKNVVPFDIDPSQISAGKTHFEQIYDRAIAAMNNTVTVFDHANELSQALRGLQDTVNQFSRNVDQQERDYKNRMIEIFGYPYAGDIGPGQTYPSGYDGPDLYHYMYVNTVELNGDTAPPSEAFFGFFSATQFGLDLSDGYRGKDFFFPDDAPGNPGDRLATNILQVSYPFSPADYGFTAPASWGQRRAPGQIQMALSDMVQSQARYKQALLNYDNLILQIQDKTNLLQAKYNLQADKIQIHKGENAALLTLSGVTLAAKVTSASLETAKYVADKGVKIATETLPKTVGTSSDVFAPVRGALYLAGHLASATLVWGKEAADNVAEAAKDGKDTVKDVAEWKIQKAEFEYEIQQELSELEELFRQEAPLRVEAFAQREVLAQSLGKYQAALAAGLRLADERVAFRKNAAADTQASRYQDMTFRIFRNDAIQKYRAQFDLAAQYVFLAAVAYDYETQLLGGHAGAGRAFLTDIVKQRALGEIINGVPVAGRHGLADPLGRLNQNFGVLKGQLGFNNPQTETGRFSLRNELFRISTNSDAAWRAELKKMIVPNLWDVPEFRRYCRPFAPESAGPQPGLVIRFPTTVTFGLNYFGWPLGGGDNAYDPTLFATKVRSAGVWFDNYLVTGLSQTPRVYLVPAGADVMRSPSGNDLETREWRVVDQKIPVPFPIGFSSLNDTAWIPMNDSLSDTFADIRRFSSFRAYNDGGGFTTAEATTDSRLIGRSVWNTDWMLIIPGGTFLFDPNQGLDTFINSVGDIKIFFQTYAYSGN